LICAVGNNIEKCSPENFSVKGIFAYILICLVFLLWYCCEKSFVLLWNVKDLFFIDQWMCAIYLLTYLHCTCFL